METCRLGTVIVLLHLVNGLFIGLGLWLDEFFIDGLSMNDGSGQSFTDERAAMRGMFLAAFITIWNSQLQINMANCRKKYFKWQGGAGAILCFLSFALAMATMIVGDASDINIMVHTSGKAYPLAVTGTVTLGLTSVVAVLYLIRVCKEPSTCN